MLENPQAIAVDLKKSPEKIFLDPVYQAVILSLRSLCLGAQNQKQKWARRVLKQMGLEVFIPDLPKRITDHAYLLYYQKNPNELKKDVEHFARKIRSSINLEISYEDSRKDIQDLFKHIFKVEPPKSLLRRDRFSQINTLALAFLCFQIQAPYPALKKIYYSKK